MAQDVSSNLRGFGMSIARGADIDMNEYVGKYVRFEVFMAVTMKNGVFWDVTPRGSCNRRLGET
jgi:hypothetical protein